MGCEGISISCVLRSRNQSWAPAVVGTNTKGHREGAQHTQSSHLLPWALSATRLLHVALTHPIPSISYGSKSSYTAFGDGAAALGFNNHLFPRVNAECFLLLPRMLCNFPLVPISLSLCVPNLPCCAALLCLRALLLGSCEGIITPH